MTYDTPERRARAQRLMRKVLDQVAQDKTQHHNDPGCVNVAIGALLGALMTATNDVHPDDRAAARRFCAEALCPAGTASEALS